MTTERARDRELSTVPPAKFGSYYGRPVLKRPVWKSPDVAGYLFLGGLAGASSVLGAAAQASRRPKLARVNKLAAIAAGLGSLAALIHDLGRPARFLNMLRVFKITSPMSVGSWLLSGYVPVAGLAAASAATGRTPRIGAAASAGAAVLGPAVASYTAVLISDTAVPAWHEGYREMPFVFVGSAAAAAGGLGMLAAPTDQTGPARAMAVMGTATELTALDAMRRRLGPLGEPYSTGSPGRFLTASTALSVLGACGALLGRKSRMASALSGAALLAASAATRWGIFHAGIESASDPRYTVEPQRRRRHSEAARASS
jgi:Polysulphide reductase, NrfD